MPRSRWIPVVVLAGFAVVYVVLPYSALSGPLYVAIGLSVVMMLISAWRRFDLDQRPGWLWLTLGVVCWVVGDVTWFMLDAMDIRNFPSLADAWYLAAYPFWWLAFGRISRTARSSRGEVVDAAIVSVAIGIVTWTLVLGPLVTDPTLPTAVRWTTLAYTIGDMLLVLLIAVAVLAKHPRKADHVLLATAIAVFLLTNLFYTHGELTGTYIAAGVFDLGWLTTYLLFVAAAWHPSATQPPPPKAPQLTVSNARLVMLGGAGLLAPLITLVNADQDPQVRRIASLATMLILVLVIYRIAGLNRHIGIYVETLEQLSQTDPLTGALNRRQLDRTLAQELVRAQRTANPLTVALLDVDHFKAFNDTHGHAEGDRVLRDLVEAWREHVRDFDAIARYGGEEFVVVFPSTTTDEAVNATERLRAAVPDGQRVSAGVATYETGDTADELMRRADRALYRAKRAGRDRVMVADRDEMSSILLDERRIDDR